MKWSILCGCNGLSLGRRISFKGAVSEEEVRDSSVEMLQDYLSSITEAIVGSVSQCPPVMRVTFKQLHKRVEERFTEPENEVGPHSKCTFSHSGNADRCRVFMLKLHCRQDVKYLAISGFFFLRFFAPAILTPKLFQLREQHADTRTSRTLLLLAKVQSATQNTLKT